MTQSASFDSLALRRTLGAFTTGVTVVTLIDDAGRWQGLTVNSFNSVSLNPPLILWSLGLGTSGFDTFQNAERFVVNILAADQVAVSQRFAMPIADKFAGIPVRRGLGGAPLLEGCVAALECRTETIYPGGDHIIFIGRVERLHHDPQRPPLLYYQGRYREIGQVLPAAD